MPTGRPNRSAHRPVDEASQYIERVSRHAKTLLRRSRRSHLQTADRHDIASRIVVRVWANLDDYRSRYANPEALASSMIDHMVVDFLRNNGAQRGEGARHLRKMGDLESWTHVAAPLGDISRLDPEDPTPQQRARRTYEPASTVSLTATEPTDVDTMLNRLEAEETCAMMRAALLGAGVKSRGLWLLQQVDGGGRTVVEVARELGISRETAQRELGRVRAAARASVAQWRADSSPDAT